MQSLTQILDGVAAGDPQAAEQLLPLVYGELRKLAAARLAQERPGQTLQATALVHEAYLRLVGQPASGGREPPDAPLSDVPINQGADAPRSPAFHSRGHFFSAAAEAMRRILVESARRKARLKHGGGCQRVDLDGAAAVTDDGDENLVALDDALTRLEAEDPAAATVVKLRYFAGLTIEEAAQALDISVRTVNRHWAFARAWLYQRLS